MLVFAVLLYPFCVALESYLKLSYGYTHRSRGMIISMIRYEKHIPILQLTKARLTSSQSMDYMYFSVDCRINSFMKIRVWFHNLMCLWMNQLENGVFGHELNPVIYFRSYSYFLFIWLKASIWLYKVFVKLN